MGESAGEQPPGHPGRAPAHLKPARGSDIYDDLPDDEHLDRLLGDAELLYHLQTSGYAAHVWKRPAEEFARYGYDVLTGWVFTGRIWAEVYRKTGRHPRRPNVPFDADAVHDLAQDTVVAALDAFLEKILKRNRWDPERGASLKTYFIGQCCMQFENVLRSHYRRQARLHESVLADPSDWANLLQDAPAPDQDVLEVARLEEILDVVSVPAARDAFVLQWLGFSEHEIAERLGHADAKAIQNMLTYQRHKVQQQRRKEQAG